MRTGIRPWAVMFMAAVALASRVDAADLVLFDALEADAEEWAASGLAVQRMGTMLLFTENNASGAEGAASVKQPLAYLRDGNLTFAVNGLTGGRGALDLVFYSATGASMASTTLAEFKGQAKVNLDSLPEAPAGAAAISFKVNLSGYDGAKAQIGALRYSLPLKGKKPIADEDEIKGERWKIESLQRTKGSGPRRYTLKPGDKSGCILFDMPLAWSAGNGMHVVLHLPLVEKGKVTVQAQPLDEGNQALAPVDVLQGIGPGWHAVDLGALNLDEATRTIVLKFWLFGESDASFAMDRLIVHGP
jgi:hypothetical protein